MSRKQPLLNVVLDQLESLIRQLGRMWEMNQPDAKHKTEVYENYIMPLLWVLKEADFGHDKKIVFKRLSIMRTKNIRWSDVNRELGWILSELKKKEV